MDIEPPPQHLVVACSIDESGTICELRFNQINIHLKTQPKRGSQLIL